MERSKKQNQLKNSFESVIKSLSKSFDVILDEINSHPYISFTLNAIRFKQFDMQRQIDNLQCQILNLEKSNVAIQNDIEECNQDYAERLSALEQGYKAAQPQEKSKVSKLPEDVYDFISRLSVLNCDNFSCSDCLLNISCSCCFLGIAKELRRKYVEQD